MKNRSYILLGLAILVLGTLFVLKRPERVVEVSYTLPDWQLPIDTSRVVRIGIRKGTASVNIERKHGVWRHERGDRANADGAMVTRLLKGVADFRLLGLVSSNPRKQDLFDVGESGTSVMVATDDGREMSLVVGKMTSLPSRSYVRPTTSDMVYLARGLTPDVVEGEAFGSLRVKTFRIDSASILMISVEMGETTVRAHREGRSWFSVETPIPAEQISPVLASLQEIHAEEAGVWTIPAEEKPLLTVDILEQKRDRLEFYAMGSNDSSYALKTSFSTETYSVDIGTAQPLLRLVSFVLSRQALVSQREEKPVAKPLPAMPKPLPPRVQPPAKKTVAARPITTPEPRVSALPPKAVPKKTTETEAKPGTSDDEGVLTVHVVKQGESLESIAQQYSITRDQLMQWNLLTGDAVRPGTELYVFVKRK